MSPRPVEVTPFVIVLVGKPARGKSYTARKLTNYLNWLGYQARVFNVGSYRRKRLGAGQDASFFDPNNASGFSARRQMAVEALDDLVQWMKGGGKVALYDATNSTRERRAWVRRRCEAESLQVVFLELQADDPALIEANVRRTKVTSPDYQDVAPEDAVSDFRRRLGHYEAVYEPVDESEGAFLRVVDVGRMVVMHRIEGHLPLRMVPFLAKLHLTPRPIFFCRHGQSLYNLEQRVGGDPDLSPKGQAFAGNLARHVDTLIARDAPHTIWTSTLRRTRQTAERLARPNRAWKLLDEIDAGRLDGLTYKEIERRHPEEFAARSADKYRYRYPQGESYEDLIARLDPVVLECERQEHPVLIVAHQAVLRALWSYFAPLAPEQCPYTPIDLHTLFKVTPSAYGTRIEPTFLGP